MEYQMIKSMTAFAREESTASWGTLTWEIRSVNHRYLEAFVRLPDELRGLEQSVRDLVGKRLNRGKVECVLRYKAEKNTQNDIVLNETYTQSVIDTADKVGMMMGGAGVANPLEVMRWPGVITEQETDMGPVKKAALDALDATLKQLIGTRQREGERINDMFTPRLAQIDDIVVQVKERRPKVLEGIREKLQGRVEELVNDVNQDRLEQELVMLAQKLDVDEELDRLGAHVKEVRDVLKRKEPVGRRLDFLMQELNREANTLGSKANDTETTQCSVDLKVLIEQMREQVQNIE
jgi:uncharacterized protein (TIGR00255 family)